MSDSSTVVSRRTHRIRSDSVKSSRRHRQSKVSDSEKENAAYKRSSSVHFLPRKTNFLTKDANLKASNIKQNKRKGRLFLTGLLTLYDCFCDSRLIFLRIM